MGSVILTSFQDYCRHPSSISGDEPFRTDKNDVHFMQFVCRRHKDIDQPVQTVYI
jgi:hypothetical protein